MNWRTTVGLVATVILSMAAATTLHFLLLLAEAAGVLLEIIAQALEVTP